MKELFHFAVTGPDRLGPFHVVVYNRRNRLVCSEPHASQSEAEQAAPALIARCNSAAKALNLTARNLDTDRGRSLVCGRLSWGDI